MICAVTAARILPSPTLGGEVWGRSAGVRATSLRRDQPRRAPAQRERAEPVAGDVLCGAEQPGFGIDAGAVLDDPAPDRHRYVLLRQESVATAGRLTLQRAKGAAARLPQVDVDPALFQLTPGRDEVQAVRRFEPAQKHGPRRALARGRE